MNTLIGRLGAPPVTVGALRGLLEAAVISFIGFLTVQANGVAWADLAPFAPAVFWALRTAEGLADHLIDPEQNRSPINVEAPILPPALVGALRGGLESAVLAGLAYLGVELTRLDWGELAAFVPAALLGIRTLEGLADQFIDPKQNRRVLPNL